ncbi:MAG: hypothetical protein MRY32_00775 [Rickettsiales bacterium]|nr:hypothetical protein [Rickettsiales bacterium]
MNKRVDDPCIYPTDTLSSHAPGAPEYVGGRGGLVKFDEHAGIRGPNSDGINTMFELINTMRATTNDSGKVAIFRTGRLEQFDRILDKARANGYKDIDPANIAKAIGSNLDITIDPEFAGKPGEFVKAVHQAFEAELERRGVDPTR